MILKTITLLVVIFTDVSSAENPCEKRNFTADIRFWNERHPNYEILDLGLDDDDRAYILEYHNNIRSKVALGNETRAGGLPHAVNMLEMEWDFELEAIAQKQVEQCTMESDCEGCRRVERFSLGTNALQDVSHWPVSRKDHIHRSFNAWYDWDVQYFNKSTLSSFVPDTSYRNLNSLTQIIWAKTWKIGCGYIHYKLKQERNYPYVPFFICRYGPSGNIVGKPVYKTSCCLVKSSIPGLCKRKCMC